MMFLLLRWGSGPGAVLGGIGAGAAFAAVVRACLSAIDHVAVPGRAHTVGVVGEGPSMMTVRGGQAS
jgi:hypothetical protein